MVPVGSWCGGGGGGLRLGLLEGDGDLADSVSLTGPLKLMSEVTGGRNWGIIPSSHGLGGDVERW